MKTRTAKMITFIPSMGTVWKGAKIRHIEAYFVLLQVK
jgi:hypothetical protein